MKEENKKTVKNTNDFIEKLANIDPNNFEPNMSLILEDEAKEIEGYVEQMHKFLKEHPTEDSDKLSSDEKDKLYDELFNIHADLKKKIKHAKCHFNITGVEFETIYKKIHQSIIFSAESVFYAINLKYSFLDKFPKTNNDFATYNMNITFTQSVLLHHLLSDVKLKGLNKESYSVANVLLHLSEISKVYQYYDKLSNDMKELMLQWNFGLSKKEVDELKTEVVTRLTKDEIDAAEKMKKDAAEKMKIVD
jgi:hypothetical protein